MTKDEIMNLTPDQLRAEIARRKGWKEPGITQIITHEMALDAGNPALEGREIEWLRVENTPPDWTNDLNLAWELAEEMNAKSNVQVELGIHDKWTTQRVPKYALVYSRGHVPHENFNLVTLLLGDTPAIAICRAWLMWDEMREKTNG